MDYFNEPLFVGERVAFITASGNFQSATIVEIVGDDSYPEVKLHTDGNRYTIVRCNRCIKEPV